MQACSRAASKQVQLCGGSSTAATDQVGPSAARPFGVMGQGATATFATVTPMNKYWNNRLLGDASSHFLLPLTHMKSSEKKGNFKKCTN